MDSYAFSVGDFRLMVVTDGASEGTEQGLADTFKPLPDDFLQAFRDLPKPYWFSFNVLYLETDKHRLLIDTGIGAGRNPQMGKALGRLVEAGVVLDQIDTVAISHFHGDHIGGLVTDDKPTFANAELLVPRLEWEYSFESGKLAADRIQMMKAAFQPYQNRLRYLNDGDTVIEGVTLHTLPGHTPGHSGFMIESAGERLFHVVDSLHQVMQMPYPDVSPVYDSHPDLSPKTRRAVLGRVADEGLLMLGYHLPFQGLGHVQRDGAGFIWQPI